jgi:hypothetical protein
VGTRTETPEAGSSQRGTLGTILRNSRYLDTALILIGVVILATTSPVSLGDGAVRYRALNTLLLHGTDTEMKYSFIGPLFSAPLWYLGGIVKSHWWWVGRYNLILFLLGLVAFWLIFRNHLDAGIVRKFMLLLIAASMFPAHVIYYYGEMFTAVLVGAGLAAVMIRRSRAAWAAVAVGVANTPATIVGLVLVIGKRILDSRRLRYALVGVGALVLITAETWIRHHQFIDRAYTNDHGYKTLAPYSGGSGFSYPFAFGLVSILFSFGKGLIFYVPGLLLPVRRALQRVSAEMWQLYLLWLLFIAGLVLVYSRWWAWHGGGFWGPRFFLLASIPASMALAVRIHGPSPKALTNLFVLAILALSIWVGINGAVYSGARLRLCRTNHFQLEELCFYVPEFSVLWRPFAYNKHALTLHDFAFIAFALAVFVRMAAPLVKASVAASRATWAQARADYFRPSAWRL